MTFDTETLRLPWVRQLPPLCPSRWPYPMCQSCFERNMPLALKLSHLSLGILFHPAQANCGGGGLLVKSKPKIKASMTSELHWGKRTLRAWCSCSAYWTVCISDVFYLLSACFLIASGSLPCFYMQPLLFWACQGISRKENAKQRQWDSHNTASLCLCIDTKLGKVFKPRRSRWLGSITWIILFLKCLLSLTRPVLHKA